MLRIASKASFPLYYAEVLQDQSFGRSCPARIKDSDTNYFSIFEDRLFILGVFVGLKTKLGM